MKPQQILVPLVASTFLAAAPLAGASQEPPAGEAPSAGKSFDERLEEFRSKFGAAAKVNSRDEMARLVRSYVQEAVHEVIQICMAIEQQTSEDLERRIDELRKAWRQAFDSSFVGNVYEYYSLQTTQMKRERGKMQTSFDRQVKAIVDNMAGPNDGPTYELLGGEFRGLGEAFESVGDLFHASSSWYNYALCFDELHRPRGADLGKAVEGYRRFVELRDQLDLTDDGFYRDATGRLKALADIGYGDDPVVQPLDPADPGGDPGGADPASAPAAAAAAAPVTVALVFEALEDVEGIARPNFEADEFYPIWPSIWLGEVGSAGRFNSMDPSPSLLRSGSARIDLDYDNDAQADGRVPIKGDVVVTQIELRDGTPRPWAFFSRPGVRDEYYQDIQVNLEPAEQGFNLYVLNAASMVGEINGTAVRILDDNMDGVYGSYPLSWDYIGLGDGAFQPEMDAIVVGGDKRARPWSEYQKIGDQWYQLEAVEQGTQLKATPVQLKTGRLVLDYAGGAPTWLVVKGSDRFANCYFDLADAKKGVEVPVGRYELFAGELRKGKRKQAVKAVILPGQGGTSWTVKVDGETVVELGEPYAFDFDFTVDGALLAVAGESVRVVGAGGERYERLWGCRPRPEVSWREAGDKRGSKPEEMEVMLDVDQLTEHGFEQAWYPFTLEVDLGQEPEGGVEVQLTEKKNKLFGKVESPWKG